MAGKLTDIVQPHPQEVAWGHTVKDLMHGSRVDDQLFREAAALITAVVDHLASCEEEMVTTQILHGLNLGFGEVTCTCEECQKLEALYLRAFGDAGSMMIVAAAPRLEGLMAMLSETYEKWDGIVRRSRV